MSYDEFKARLDAIAPDRFEKDDDQVGNTLTTITGSQIGLWIPRIGTHQFFVEFDEKTVGAGSTAELALEQAEWRIKLRQSLLEDALLDIRVMRQALRLEQPDGSAVCEDDHPVISEDDDQC